MNEYKELITELREVGSVSKNGLVLVRSEGLYHFTDNPNVLYHDAHLAIKVLLELAKVC